MSAVAFLINQIVCSVRVILSLRTARDGRQTEPYSLALTLNRVKVAFFFFLDLKLVYILINGNGKL